MEVVSESISKLEDAGYTPVISGMVWMQGEADGRYLDSANEYRTNLENFINAVRFDLESILTLAPGELDSMPFVFGQIANKYHPVTGEYTWDHGDKIQAAQTQVNDNNTDFPEAGMVVTQDLMKSMVHYWSEGLMDMGECFAEMMTRMQGGSSDDLIICGMPRVHVISPLKNSEDMGVNDPIFTTFFRDMDSASFHTGSFIVTEKVSQTEVPGTVSYDPVEKKAVFTPITPLDYSTTYVVLLTTDICDPVGNHMSNDYQWAFTTIAGP